LRRLLSAVITPAAVAKFLAVVVAVEIVVAAILYVWFDL
jgi:hypothetical protein